MSNPSVVPPPASVNPSSRRSAKCRRALRFVQCAVGHALDAWTSIPKPPQQLIKGLRDLRLAQWELESEIHCIERACGEDVPRSGVDDSYIRSARRRLRAALPGIVTMAKCGNTAAQDVAEALDDVGRAFRTLRRVATEAPKAAERVVQ